MRYSEIKGFGDFGYIDFGLKNVFLGFKMAFFCSAEKFFRFLKWIFRL
jgi:hypothetical protein